MSFKPMLRHFALGFVLTGALVAGVSQPGAQGIAGHNSDAPVNFGADRIELQDKSKRVVLSGNVDITQAELKLRAARTTLNYSDGGGLKLHRLDAVGSVNVTRGNESARGDSAVYDFDKRIITMVGNVALRRGTDNLNGGRLTMDLNSGLSSVDGRGAPTTVTNPDGTTTTTRGGRVSGTFSVPKKN